MKIDYINNTKIIHIYIDDIPFSFNEQQFENNNWEEICSFTKYELKQIEVLKKECQMIQLK